MKILAVEFSTEEASIALLESDGARLLTEHVVEAHGKRSQELFPAVEALLSEESMTLEDIRVFAAGIGPGSYTGLRVAITAVRGWAMPKGRRVWTVSSAAAIAAEWLARTPGADTVAVWGDARRGLVWAGRFIRATGAVGEAGGVIQIGDFEVVERSRRGSLWPVDMWTPEGRPPRAEWIGRLCIAGGISAALEPIYVNPAVQIAPRFDANGRAMSHSAEREKTPFVPRGPGAAQE